MVWSKTISNDQELIQSDPISCPQNQKGNNWAPVADKSQGNPAPMGPFAALLILTTLYRSDFYITTWKTDYEFAFFLP